MRAPRVPAALERARAGSLHASIARPRGVISSRVPPLFPTRRQRDRLWPETYPLDCYVNADAGERSVGGRRESESGSARPPAAGAREGREHNTRVLEAVLVRRGEAPAPARPRSVVPSPAARRPPSAPPAPSWSAVPGAPAPVPVSEMAPMPGGSPFAGLELGSQTAVFGGTGSGNLSEMETSPLAALGSAFAAGHGNAVETGAAQPRELPPDLYPIYGNYLRDMQPEAPITEAPTAETPALLGAAPP